MTDQRPRLPDAFVNQPIAHRGLHDRSIGIVENSRAAFEAAINAGFCIELDVQQSSDQKAMVFHDDDLVRLVDKTGPISAHSSTVLQDIRLTGSANYIETLPQILSFVSGRVPVLIEIKDQDGAMGPGVGPLETSVAAAIDGYEGPLALMSFNPNSVRLMKELAPERPRGLVTDPFHENWPLAQHVRDHLRAIPDYDDARCSFVSHNACDLMHPRIAELKRSGATVLCWTIKSQAEADQALHVADNITFEGFEPA